MVSITEQLDYRYERKFFISSINRQEVESIVNLHPAMFAEIFHKRFVNNIYFDSSELTNYFDNIYGNTRRIKTRIRWYGELFGEIKKPVMEIKIKNGSLGSKLRYLLQPFKLDNHFNIEGVSALIQCAEIPEIIKLEFKYLQPVLLNRYKREYYLSADKRYRITIDSDQIFYKMGRWSNSFMNKMKDKTNSILELKYDLECDDGAKHITDQFPFRLTKSSKYLMGIERVLCVNHE